jgi:hypothetical protein
VLVSDSDGLRAALLSWPPRDIVLGPGVYDDTAPFRNWNGHRIYSATLGGAVLHAGLVVGSNWSPDGALVQGIAFDVNDPSKTLQNSIIHVWGRGHGVQIRDVTLEGNDVIGTAIVVRQPEGLVIQRARARDFRVNGITVDANVLGMVVAAPVLLEDLDVANVSFAEPKSSNGTAEACLWLGNSGTLRRALLRNCAWTGLWAGTSNAGSMHEDLDIDGAGAGVYIEHFVTGSTFQRIRTGPNVATGVMCEWADPIWGAQPACDSDIIQDSTIASALIGVFLDSGTTRTIVRRVLFLGMTTAAIRNRDGIENEFVDNDYSGIGAGAVPIQP